MLRSVFMYKFCKNKSPQKILPKKNYNLGQFFFRQFKKIYIFGVCKNLGCLGPLVLEEIDPAQTVVNPLGAPCFLAEIFTFIYIPARWHH
jgi:hypothetical protein